MAKLSSIWLQLISLAVGSTVKTRDLVKLNNNLIPTGTLPIRKVSFGLAGHPRKAAAPAIPLSRRSDANLNFRLSRWTDALRLFVVVYCVSRFVNIILRNEAVLFVTTP